MDADRKLLVITVDVTDDSEFEDSLRHQFSGGKGMITTATYHSILSEEDSSVDLNVGSGDRWLSNEDFLRFVKDSGEAYTFNKGVLNRTFGTVAKSKFVQTLADPRRRLKGLQVPDDHEMLILFSDLRKLVWSGRFEEINNLGPDGRKKLADWVQSINSEIPIETLDLRVRSYNSLKRAKIETIGDLAPMTFEDLAALPHIPREWAKEIQEDLAKNGLSLAS